MQAAEWEEIDRSLFKVLDLMRNAAERHPTRELSLAITNLQQAELWFAQVKIEE